MYVLAAKLVRKLMNIMLHEATDHEHTIVTNNGISRNRHSEAAALDYMYTRIQAWAPVIQSRPDTLNLTRT